MLTKECPIPGAETGGADCDGGGPLAAAALWGASVKYKELLKDCFKSIFKIIYHD